MIRCCVYGFWVLLFWCLFSAGCGQSAALPPHSVVEPVLLGTIARADQPVSIEPEPTVIISSAGDASFLSFRVTAQPSPPTITPTYAPTTTTTVTVSVLPETTTLATLTPTIPVDEAVVVVTPTRVVPTYIFPVRAAWVDYGPYHHDYPATDIFCPVGSEFLAATSGIVDFVNRVDQWNTTTDRPEDRGGLMLAIVGDDGWRYYGSHLSAIAEGIAPGVRVEAGQVLGYTGNSGNASGTPPHLHFGISHPTYPEDWQTRRGELPPYDYLRAWERGEMITPGL